MQKTINYIKLTFMYRFAATENFLSLVENIKGNENRIILVFSDILAHFKKIKRNRLNSKKN